MKKALVILLILAVAGGAFAQLADGLRLTVMSRSSFVPFEALATDGSLVPEDFRAGLGQTWGGTGANGGTLGRQRLQFQGTSEKMGFEFWITNDGGPIALHDFGWIWARPIPQLRIGLGAFNDDVLAGKLSADDDWHHFVISAIDQDITFTRFAGRGSSPSALLTLYPMDGLVLGLNVRDLQGIMRTPHLAPSWVSTNDVARQEEPQIARDAWARVQVGAGYVIPDIGHLRFQYLGERPWHRRIEEPGSLDAYGNAPGATTAARDNAAIAQDIFWHNFDTSFTSNITNYKRFEVAFALTMVQGMVLDIGAKIPLPEKVTLSQFSLSELGYNRHTILNGATYKAPMQVNFGWQMGFGDIGMRAFFMSQFLGGRTGGGDDKIEYGPKFNVQLVPSYNLGNNMLVGMHIGMEAKLQDKYGSNLKNNYFDVGFGPWVRIDLGKGFLRVGATYTIMTWGSGHQYLDIDLDGATAGSYPGASTNWTENMSSAKGPRDNGVHAIIRVPIVLHLNF